MSKMKQRSRQPAESTQNTRMSSPQLEALCASLPDAIIVWDRAERMLYLNAAALTLFEVQASDSLVGTSAQQFFQRFTWCDEQQRSFFFAPWLLDLTPLHEAAAPRSYEQTLLLGLPSHRQMVLELRCSLVLDAEQQPIGMLAVFHEVAPHYQKALHMQRVYEALVTLNEAIARIPEQLPWAGSGEALLFSPLVLLVAQPLVDVIRQVLACWRVNLIAFRSLPMHVSYGVGSGFTAEQEQQRRELSGRFLLTEFVDDRVLARLQANQEVIIATDHIRIPPGYSAEFGAANILALPLFLEQKLAGMLLVHKHGWESEYSREEIELVRAVAAQALLLVDCLDSLQKPLGEQARSLVLPEADRLSQDFLMLASHELRTPLTGIKGHLQLAQRRLERLKGYLGHESECLSRYFEQTQMSLEAAEQSVRRQERMLQDMIDDARIQTSQLTLSLKRCDLLVLLKEALARQQRSSMPERRIVLEILTGEQAVPIIADAERIKHVISTYITNALTYSPTERSVIVRLMVEEAVVRISVQDAGPGISGEEQTRLWERAYRARGNAVQHELDLSLGFGLYLCRAFIELHHGSVGVQSTPGQGTTFWLTLPLPPSAGA